MEDRKNRYKAKRVIVAFPDKPVSGKDRELIPRDATVRVLAANLGKIGITFPVKESDLERISDFFSEEEVTWANAAACGDEYDKEYLEDVSNGFDDFFLEEGDFIDLEKLNLRISALLKNS